MSAVGANGHRIALAYFLAGIPGVGAQGGAPDRDGDGPERFYPDRKRVMAPHIVWPGVSGPPIPARAATGGPDQPGHDGKGRPGHDGKGWPGHDGKGWPGHDGKGWPGHDGKGWPGHDGKGWPGHDGKGWPRV
jgi:hypothetical protein